MSCNTVTLLTATGSSAIAVIRLSGPGVDAFLSNRFSKPLPAGRCVHGLLREEDRVIDDAVAVRSAEGVDLNLHGGLQVIRSVIALAERDGFSISHAPVVNGKTDIWNEVLSALPAAKTEMAVRMLLAQPAAWELLPTTAEDRQKIREDRSGRWLIDTPTLAIVGPANVGKSTLANQLFGQARSITADLPGTTRDWVGEIANIDGLAVMLIDTPGQRATADPIEHAAIVGSLPKIRQADAVVLVLDQSVSIDADMLAAYPDAIRVANKSDAPHRWEAANIEAIETVAVDGRGVDDLRIAIRRRFGFEALDVGKIRWWTERQLRLLL